MNQPPKLWIVAERPVRLPNALVAAESLRDRFPGGIHFVRDQSDAWQRVQWQPYSCHFDDVHTFARVKSCRGLLDLPRLYRDTMERRRKRSEERRVGKECRARWSPDHSKNK